MAEKRLSRKRTQPSMFSQTLSFVMERKNGRAETATSHHIIFYRNYRM